MKRLIARISIEIIVILTAAITAARLVKTGHPVLGLWLLAAYSVFNLYRLGISKINIRYRENINEGRQHRLEGDLSIKTEQVHRLEAALVGAATEALWVSDVAVRDNKVVYKIDVPEQGRFVVKIPVADDATKNDDVPATSEEG